MYRTAFKGSSWFFTSVKTWPTEDWFEYCIFWNCLTCWSLYFLASMSLSVYTFHRKVLSRDTECFWVKTGGNFLLNPLYIPVSMYLTKSFSCLTIGHMHNEESVDTVPRICTSNFSRPRFPLIHRMALNLDFSSLLPFQIQGTGLGSNAWDVWPLHLGLNCDGGYHSHTKQAYLTAKMKIIGFYW